jgi:hypothetical protein
MSDLSPLCAQERISQKVKRWYRYTGLSIQVPRGEGVLPLRLSSLMAVKRAFGVLMLTERVLAR